MCNGDFLRKILFLIIFAWIFLVFIIPLSAWIVIHYTGDTILGSFMRVLIPGLIFAIFILIWWRLVLILTKSEILSFRRRYPTAVEQIERLEREEIQK